MKNTKKTVFEPVASTLRQATNERWYYFFVEFLRIATRWTPEKLGIAALYAAFVAMVATADRLLEQVSKSWLTGKIKTADGERDECINGFRAAVKALLKSANKDKREAAERMNITLDGYGDVARRDYAAESGLVLNLLQDMNGKHAKDVAVTELGEWITDMERFNTTVMTLVDERYAEKVDKPAEKLAEVRRETDHSFGNILTVIEGVMLTTPDHGLEEFVKELNVLIVHYRTLAAQDKGRRNARKTAAGE
jgi:hypothetical protein